MQQFTARRPSGEYTIINEYGERAQGETLSCVHCGRMWIVQPGSGRQRGYCLKCGGPTCGAKDCTDRCLPFERQLEIIEQRHRLYRSMERQW